MTKSTSTQADGSVGLFRVFVMGCSRGGTTLMQRLVADRLGLYTLPETRFFANMIGNVEPRMFPTTQRHFSLHRRLSSQLREVLGRGTGMRLLDIPGLPPIEGRKWAPFPEMTAEFLARMDGLAVAEGADGWLEKTPFHVLYAPLIARLVPGAWMIHILRDAQETVGSIRDAANCYRDPWAIIYDRVERDVDNWNASTAASVAMIGQPRQIFVPYAALTRAPVPVMNRVAMMVGIKVSEIDTHTASSASTDPPSSSPSSSDLTMLHEQQWKHAAVNGGVAPALSKWDSALTPAERERAKPLIRPIPAALMREMAPFFALAGLSEEKVA